MEEINLQDFIEFLKNGASVKKYIVHLKGNNKINIGSFQGINLEVSDCKFIGEGLEIIGSYERLEKFDNYPLYKSLCFKNCTFSGLSFKNCEIKELHLDNLNIVEGTLEINEYAFENLAVKGFKDINYNFRICQTDVLIKTEILGNKFIDKGSISFFNSKFKNSDFTESCYNDLLFQTCEFSGRLDFFKNRLFDSTNRFLFDECSFEKVNFNETRFSQSTEFNDCKFFKTITFHDIRSSIKTSILFESCLFEKFVQFNYASIYKLEINNVKFNEMVSFQETNFNKISIDRTIFGGGALFDDLNKSNTKVIENWDRKTLREIKRELANSHNQIDYLRFKAYELNAYKKESGKNWKDSLLLYFNQKSNSFGLDWTKGVSFILFTSFIFYVLYLITYAIVMKNSLYFPNSIEDFFVKYLKFANPLSFLKSPIEDAESYFFPFFFFIIGKIFVSYGIYQTIQAFRKFGVSGG